MIIKVKISNDKIYLLKFLYPVIKFNQSGLIIFVSEDKDTSWFQFKGCLLQDSYGIDILTPKGLLAFLERVKYYDKDYQYKRIKQLVDGGFDDIEKLYKQVIMLKFTRTHYIDIEDDVYFLDGMLLPFCERFKRFDGVESEKFVLQVVRLVDKVHSATALKQYRYGKYRDKLLKLKANFNKVMYKSLNVMSGDVDYLRDRLMLCFR
jgi:hypothetical protein